MNFLKLILISLSLSACTHALHVYHVSDSEYLVKPHKSKKIIKSEASQNVILGFVQDTNYANQAFNKLRKQCRNGKVTSINTRYSTSHSFMSWTNKVHMEAYCVR